MKQKDSKRKLHLNKPLILVLSLALLMAGAIAYRVFTYDASSKPKNNMVKEFQVGAARDASSMQGRVNRGADIATLQRDDSYENSRRAPGVISGTDEIYWDRVSYDDWETGGGLFYKSGTLYGCYRLTANTLKKLVTYEPKACSSLGDLPSEIDTSSEEVILEKNVVDRIRNSYNDEVQCYPSGNAYQYQCKQ